MVSAAGRARSAGATCSSLCGRARSSGCWAPTPSSRTAGRGRGSIAAYINFDMVGRSRDNKLALRAMGSSSIWPELIEQANVPVGLDLTVGDDPYLPTDTLTLNRPRCRRSTSSPAATRTTTGRRTTPTLINYEDLERIVRFGTLVASKVHQSRLRPGLPQGRAQDRLGRRPRLGARLHRHHPRLHHRGRGPAALRRHRRRPGRRGGNPGRRLIVEFGGQKITNIYDYTYALDAVKIGEPLQVVLERDGERVEVTITPRARD